MENSKHLLILWRLSIHSLTNDARRQHAMYGSPPPCILEIELLTEHTIIIFPSIIF